MVANECTAGSAPRVGPSGDALERAPTGNQAHVVTRTPDAVERLREAREPILAEWRRDLLVLCGDPGAVPAANLFHGPLRAGDRDDAGRFGDDAEGLTASRPATARDP